MITFIFFHALLCSSAIQAAVAAMGSLKHHNLCPSLIMGLEKKDNNKKHLLPILILQTEMKGSYWTITGCHRFRLGGSQHLDTSSLSSARSRASGSVIICQRAGQSPRPPAAPYTLPILQPVASLEPLLRGGGRQESPSRKAGGQDLAGGKLRLCP